MKYCVVRVGLAAACAVRQAHQSIVSMSSAAPRQSASTAAARAKWRSQRPRAVGVASAPYQLIATASKRITAAAWRRIG